MKKDLLTVKELAAELRMSVKSIQRGYRNVRYTRAVDVSHGAVRSRKSSTGD
jgi:DNA-binding transcriptional regulator YhcF (GntR family)